MVQSGRLHRYTYVDYVTLEESSSTKHEYFQGEIYAMAGGSEEHSALAAAVPRALGTAPRDRAPALSRAHVRPAHLRRGNRHGDFSGRFGDLRPPPATRGEPPCYGAEPHGAGRSHERLLRGVRHDDQATEL